MSEKSDEILYGGSITLPEMDNDQETEDLQTLEAIYESSTYDILAQMNKETFGDTYNILKGDITSMTELQQQIFIEKYLDRMIDVYEFQFAQNPIYNTSETLQDFFKFIEFVEFDNITFLKYVWRYLDDILEVNISEYVKLNWKIVIEEITNQANLLITLNENISEFLRTYDKDGILDWFINRSERNKYEIYAENLE